MLVLDIETTGLDRDKDNVTCVCFKAAGWTLVWPNPERGHWATAAQMMELLDEADRIGGYNIVSFDIPFLATFFGFTDEQVGRWIRKSLDPLFCARALLGFDCCPKLSTVLELNGAPPKSGTGADALALAREERWDELASYCMQDVASTYELLMRERIEWTGGLEFRGSGFQSKERASKPRRARFGAV